MNQLRYEMILGKHPVVEVKNTHDGTKKFVSIDIGNKVYINFDVPANADVKRGDLLTLYTEVLVNAKSS